MATSSVPPLQREAAALHFGIASNGPGDETLFGDAGNNNILGRGGDDTIFGGKYEQRYFSQITTKDGKAFRMREFCNPFQTYKAFGKERWDKRINDIMKNHNVPWPASQPADPARLPGT